MRQDPFFIVGSPRSGTSILRDLLRCHSRLIAPEETHFYRWSSAFKSPQYTQESTRNQGPRRHRLLDGIGDEAFLAIYERAASRRELQDGYMAAYLALRGRPEARWFDKTPQNVYGLLLLRADYPAARYIHIHRNPLYVVASLMEGRVMPAQAFDAATSWWLDAIGSLDLFRALAGDDLLEVRYETLAATPRQELARIAGFVGEDPSGFASELPAVRPERRGPPPLLTPEQVALVLDRCGRRMQALAYDIDPAAYRHEGRAAE